MRHQDIDQALEKNSMDGALAALGKSIARWTEKEGLLETAISALSLARRDAPTEPTSYIYEPSLCVIVQGVKRELLGDDTYVLDVHHFLITAVDLPTVVQILHASRAQPYLSLLVKLDQREMAQLMVDSHLPPPRPQRFRSAMRVPRNSAASTAACLARRRYAISRPCVRWRAVQASRGALSRRTTHHHLDVRRPRGGGKSRTASTPARRVVHRDQERHHCQRIVVLCFTTDTVAEWSSTASVH